MLVTHLGGIIPISVASYPSRWHHTHLGGIIPISVASYPSPWHHTHLRGVHLPPVSCGDYLTLILNLPSLTIHLTVSVYRHDISSPKPDTIVFFDACYPYYSSIFFLFTVNTWTLDHFNSTFYPYSI